MGFHIEEGGNYSRIYPVNNESEIAKLADDIEKIFKDLYHADETAPFGVTEL